MTNEIDILKKAIAEHEKALRLKDLNVELHSHLEGSIYWVLKYGEKYNIPIPKKDELMRMLEKSDNIINTIIMASKQPIDQVSEYQPNGNTDKTTDNETVPQTAIFN